MSVKVLIMFSAQSHIQMHPATRQVKGVEEAGCEAAGSGGDYGKLQSTGSITALPCKNVNQHCQNPQFCRNQMFEKDFSFKNCQLIFKMFLNFRSQAKDVSSCMKFLNQKTEENPSQDTFSKQVLNHLALVSEMWQENPGP